MRIPRKTWCLVFYIFVLFVTLEARHAVQQQQDVLTTTENAHSAVKNEDHPFSLKEPIELQLKYGSTIHEQIIQLEPEAVVAVQSVNVSRLVEFAVFQAHSQIYPFTMSYTPTLDPGSHVNGTNIGLLVRMRNDSKKNKVFLINPHPYNVTVLTYVLFYDKSAPIPGGCNMEFEVEMAPWLRVSHDSNIISVEHQLAAKPNRNGRPHSCETQSQALHYEVFHWYMTERDFSEESYFNAIRQLRTPQDARENGREIRTFGFTPTTRSQFSLYPGVGRVFVVTVTFTDDENLPVSAYIPAVTYGCDLSQDEDCQTLNTTYSKVLCAISLFLGLFVAFAGHRYFQIEMFLIGFLTFAAVSYVVLVNHFDANATGLAAGTSVMGVLGGLLWWFIWWFWGVPALSVLPVVLALGFLVASIFFYLPISFEFLTHDFNFWSSFTCCWLVVPVICVTFTRMGNIISCAILGSYAVIVPIDHYIGSSLKYIVLNVVRRATVRGFGQAVLDPPYQDNDLILTLVWIGLAVSGVLFQFLRERKRPPFSPPAEMWRRTGHGVAAASEQTPLVADASAMPSTSSAARQYGTS